MANANDILRGYHQTTSVVENLGSEGYRLRENHAPFLLNTLAGSAVSGNTSQAEHFYGYYLTDLLALVDVVNYFDKKQQEKDRAIITALQNQLRP